MFRLLEVPILENSVNVGKKKLMQKRVLNFFTPHSENISITGVTEIGFFLSS